MATIHTRHNLHTVLAFDKTVHPIMARIAYQSGIEEWLNFVFLWLWKWCTYVKVQLKLKVRCPKSVRPHSAASERNSDKLSII